MKVFDLDYVEDEIIAGIEHFMTEAKSFMTLLQERAQGLAAAMIEKQNALKVGSMGKVGNSKPPVRPVSPNITKPRPPIIPEPQKIITKVCILINYLLFTIIKYFFCVRIYIGNG